MIGLILDVFHSLREFEAPRGNLYREIAENAENSRAPSLPLPENKVLFTRFIA
jgi:hypothetical protein